MKTKKKNGWVVLYEEEKKREIKKQTSSLDF
jgi:hypothetical protein